MRTIELLPVDGRKSFYGKAVVQIEDNNDRVLISYDTKIARLVARDASIERLYPYPLSLTTARHLKAFCGMGKKEFESLECK